MILEAIDYLKTAVGLFVKSGRFHMAANQEKEIAEIAEQELGNATLAMEWYERAADRYLGENSPAYTPTKFLINSSFLCFVGLHRAVC